MYVHDSIPVVACRVPLMVKETVPDSGSPAPSVAEVRLRPGPTLKSRQIAGPSRHTGGPEHRECGRPHLPDNLTRLRPLVGFFAGDNSRSHPRGNGRSVSECPLCFV